MKILHIASLAAALWLTGCATTGISQDPAASTSATPTTATRPAHTPVIPGGALRPREECRPSAARMIQRRWRGIAASSVGHVVDGEGSAGPVLVRPDHPDSIQRGDLDALFLQPGQKAAHGVAVMPTSA